MNKPKFDRRKFSASMAALGVTGGRPLFAAAKNHEPEVLQLSRNGWMPNNERLPVLLYRGAFDVRSVDPAAVFEHLARTVGHRSGATACTTFTTTTPPRMRCWVSPPVQPVWRWAAKAAMS